MVKSCVTISLVPQARGGPFVYWDDLRDGCRRANELGFDAIEIFAPSADVIDTQQLRNWLNEFNLRLAAVGTGAGWLLHRSSLTDANADVRERAKAFIRSIIDMGGPFGAPAIIGSMQGNARDEVDRDSALRMLGEALDELGQYASRHGVPLLYEPLNRYETNLVNTVADAVRVVSSLAGGNVKLLPDLFHMNIEETDIAEAIRTGGHHIGHVHFVDSNRRAAGFGHTDFAPVARAIRDIQYSGYLSAEAFPLPDSQAAAIQTIDSFRHWFG